ncbi:unnamed protein product [Urochloa humidicola]
MIAHAAVLCLVLFSDQLAAASKSFGGYGAAESVGQKEPETWAGPLLNPNVVIPKPFIPKPTIGYSTPEGSVFYTAGSGTPAPSEKKAPQTAAVFYDEPPAPDKKKAPQTAAVFYDEPPAPAKKKAPQTVAVSYDEPPAPAQKKAESYDEPPAPAQKKAESYDEPPAPAEKKAESYDEPPAPAKKKAPQMVAVSYDEPPAPAEKKVPQMVSVSYHETPAAAKPLPKASNNKGYGSGSGTPSSSSTTPAPAEKKAAPAASSSNKGYGGSGTPSSSSSTPAPAEKKKAAPAASSSSNKGYRGSATPSSSSSTTPAPAEKKKAAPAAASSDAGVSSSPSYGMDPAGEPEYGLNQKAIEDILKEHNVFRAKEHVPPLTWNATLAKFSQQYAETLKADCKMVHSTSPYGENLMLVSGSVTWKTTVDEWSDEKKSYHYGSNTCDAGKMCGHYTAVVWKGTTTVGCGRVVCNNGDTMIMCSYWPPGNYDGVKPF